MTKSELLKFSEKVAKRYGIEIEDAAHGGGIFIEKEGQLFDIAGFKGLELFETLFAVTKENESESENELKLKYGSIFKAEKNEFKLIFLESNIQPRVVKAIEGRAA